MKLQHVPLSASPTIPEIENTVHHICFTSLELQKREGGEQKSEFTKSTLREQLNWVSFFVFFLSWRPAKPPSQLIFHKSSCPQRWGPGRKMKAGSCLVILLLTFWFVCKVGSCGGGSNCCRCAVLHLVYSAGAKLVDPVGINPVDPALVKVDEEHHVCRGGKKNNC